MRRSDQKPAKTSIPIPAELVTVLIFDAGLYPTAGPSFIIAAFVTITIDRAVARATIGFILVATPVPADRAIIPVLIRAVHTPLAHAIRIGAFIITVSGRPIPVDTHALGAAVILLARLVRLLWRAFRLNRGARGLTGSTQRLGGRTLRLNLVLTWLRFRLLGRDRNGEC
jgi:hypothetical protein